ncbi:hypothetical protein RR48_07514 [Papilio machaon]|uniref:Uncharacterized protein n=2 Tax=Papilio TaxID=7145 RepID=A0A194PII2_PAPXU|nr:hypothetical protein RR46_13755 [Papilio xuthus]KPJ20049.1 hypothetical protein RR48_07514 [Papilio machaon]
MSGRPRTTSFAEGGKSVRKTFENQPPKPPLGGVKICSKYHLTILLSAIVISYTVTYSILTL